MLSYVYMHICTVAVLTMGGSEYYHHVTIYSWRHCGALEWAGTQRYRRHFPNMV